MIASSSPARRWLPVLLGVLVADLSFWYYASTGENDADYAGMALFAVFAAIWGWQAVSGRRLRSAIAAIGGILALGLMILRETGGFDRGYIPPYVLFLVAALIA